MKIKDAFFLRRKLQERKGLCCSETSQFRIEPFEPRLLLSGDPIQQVVTEVFPNETVATTATYEQTNTEPKILWDSASVAEEAPTTTQDGVGLELHLAATASICWIGGDGFWDVAGNWRDVNGVSRVLPESVDYQAAC